MSQHAVSSALHSGHSIYRRVRTCSLVRVPQAEEALAAGSPESAAAKVGRAAFECDARGGAWRGGH